MKFSSALIVSLGVFVASCYAKCNCAASDQPCMDKCVLAANSCIVKCENTGGDSCQQACILSNWPSMPVAKDVLADATSVAATATGTGAVATGVLTTGSISGGSILPTSAASVSEFVSTYSTTLSGGSVSLVTSTIKPSAIVSSGGLPRSSSAPSPKMDNSNTSSAVRQQVLSAVTVGAIMASVAWIL